MMAVYVRNSGVACMVLAQGLYDFAIKVASRVVTSET